MIVSHTLYFKFYDKKKDFWQSQKLIQNHKQEGCGEGGDGIKCVDEGLMKEVNDWFFAV